MSSSAGAVHGTVVVLAASGRSIRVATYPGVERHRRRGRGNWHKGPGREAGNFLFPWRRSLHSSRERYALGRGGLPAAGIRKTYTEKTRGDVLLAHIRRSSNLWEKAAWRWAYHFLFLKAIGRGGLKAYRKRNHNSPKKLALALKYDRSLDVNVAVKHHRRIPSGIANGLQVGAANSFWPGSSRVGLISALIKPLSAARNLAYRNRRRLTDPADYPACSVHPARGVADKLPAKAWILLKETCGIARARWLRP